MSPCLFLLTLCLRVRHTILILLSWLQSNSYNSRYLADKLEIGNSAAMAYGVKRNPLLRARSSLASKLHKIDDMVLSDLEDA